MNRFLVIAFVNRITASVRYDGSSVRLFHLSALSKSLIVTMYIGLGLVTVLVEIVPVGPDQKSSGRLMFANYRKRCNVVPLHAIKARRGSRSKILSFIPSALNEGYCSSSGLGRFTPVK